MIVLTKKDTLSALTNESWTRVHCADAQHRNEVIRCVNGHNQHLPKSRTVNLDGTLSGGPLQCPVTGCNQNDSLTLQGWTPA